MLIGSLDWSSGALLQSGSYFLISNDANQRSIGREGRTIPNDLRSRHAWYAIVVKERLEQFFQWEET
ncbi:unnamed protein product [Calypogeia fissa]